MRIRHLFVDWPCIWCEATEVQRPSWNQDLAHQVLDSCEVTDPTESHRWTKTWWLSKSWAPSPPETDQDLGSKPWRPLIPETTGQEVSHCRHSQQSLAIFFSLFAFCLARRRSPGSWLLFSEAKFLFPAGFRKPKRKHFRLGGARKK